MAAHAARGNAGLFVWSDALPAVGVPFTRSFEVQILDGQNGPNYTSHGDVFGIWGATMNPTGRTPPAGCAACPARTGRSRPPSGTTIASPATAARSSWRSTARRSRAPAIASRERATSAWSRRARSATSATCGSRNCRAPAPSPAETATLDEGFVSIYSGLDLRGWKSETGHEGHWRAKDSVLDYDGKSAARDKDLWTEKAYGDFVLIADWQLPGKPSPRPRPVVLPNGDDARNPDGKPSRRSRSPMPATAASCSAARTRGRSNITCNTIGSGELYGFRVDKSMPAEVRSGSIPKVKADAPLGKWNRFVITLKKDRVTVVLNGQTVIENVELPGLPARGPIGLQHHGDPVQFTNLFIKELE